MMDLDLGLVLKSAKVAGFIPPNRLPIKANGMAGRILESPSPDPSLKPMLIMMLQHGGGEWRWVAVGVGL